MVPEKGKESLDRAGGRKERVFMEKKRGKYGERSKDKVMLAVTWKATKRSQAPLMLQARVRRCQMFPHRKICRN